jgi:predicted Zn-dependent peptidase
VKSIRFFDNINLSQLDNGVVVITETTVGTATSACGVWSVAGAADDPVGQEGRGHFVEHLMFKGTANKSSFEIASAIELLGGQFDAYTEAETIHLSARVIDKNIAESINILGDLCCFSTIPPVEFEREKSVVLEEISKAETNHDEYIMDMITSGLWPGGKYGKPIPGTNESVNAMTPQDAINGMKYHFAANNCIITAAGAFSHEDFVQMITNAFANIHPPQERRFDTTVNEAKRLQIFKQRTDHVTFAWATITFPADDDRNYPLVIIDNILGASTTSRLFTKIRDIGGLVYDVSSFCSGYSDSGFLAVTGSANDKNVKKVLQMIKDEIYLLRDKGISEAELMRAKAQIQAGMALALETTEQKMRRLATQYMTYGKIISLSEIFDKIENITIEDVNQVIVEVTSIDKWMLSLIGPVKEKDIVEKWQLL